MKGVRWIGWIFLVFAAIWGGARISLEVQLPRREGPHGAFPDPMVGDMSLREAFKALPDEGGEKTQVRLLDENVLAWLERWRLLESARESLDICYFILEQDVFGVSFLGHLIKKAEEGVQIRVLLDAMGTKMSRSFQGNDYIDTLVNTERVKVRMYRPLPYRYLDAFLTLNPAAVIVSEHDKIILADGRRALIGGRNITGEYFTPPEDDPKAFLDIDIVLSGPSLGTALKTAFEAEYESGEAKEVKREVLDLKDSTADLLLAYGAMNAWLHDEPIPPQMEDSIRKKGLPWLEELREMPHLRGALRKNLPPTAGAEVRLIDSRCRLGEADDFITRSLIRLVRSSRREIFIQSPYLVLPKEAADVLEEAGRRGVRITILTNSALSTDNPMSQAVFLEQWPELLARVSGLKIFVAGDRHNLHGKLAVFDRTLALVGTYNLDPLSIAYNSELAAAVWSESFAGELLKSRETYIAAGPPRVLQYRIDRDGKGEARLGREGEVEVKFGPEDHLGPDELAEAERYRKLFRWTWGLTPKAPFL